MTNISVTPGEVTEPYLFTQIKYGKVVLTKVFNGVEILTEDNHRFGIAQRDTGLEIICPDGAMVEVKIDDNGNTFVAAHGIER